MIDYFDQVYKFLNFALGSAAVGFLYLIARRIGAWEAFIENTKSKLDTIDKQMEKVKDALDDTVKRIYELFGQLKK